MMNQKREVNKSIQIILIIIATFIVLFATSFLFHIDMVSSSISRVTITIALMIIELGISILLLKDVVTGRS